MTVESLRSDRLGYSGYGPAATPNLDALAARGVIFTNAWTPTPEAPPALASLHTGLYPVHHGVLTGGAAALPPDAETLAEILVSRGYSTAAFPASLQLHPKYGLDQGFEEYQLSFAEIPRPRYIAEDRVPAGPVTDRVIEYLERVRDKPFFVWINYVDPHYFYEPPEPFRSRFSENPYDGEVAYVDRELGRVLDKVRDYGLVDRTIAIVAGSNGEGLGDGGEAFHGTTLQPATTRVPLLVAAGASGQPGGLAPGAKDDRIVSLVDVMPTVLDLLRIPPSDRSDGRSLLAAPDPSRAVYVGTWMPARLFGWSPLTGVVGDNHEYVTGLRSEIHALASDAGQPEDPGQAQSEVRDRLAGLASAHFGKAPDPPLSMEVADRIRSLGYEVDPAPREPRDPRDMIPIANDALKADRSARRRQLEAADFLLRSVIERDPENILALLDSGLLAGARGDLEGKRRFLERARSLAPRDGEIYYQLGNLAVESHGKGGARAGDAYYELAADLDPMHEEALYSTACALASQGEVEAALTTLEKAVNEGFRAFEWMAVDQDLDSLRSDPRFDAITQGKARGRDDPESKASTR